MTAVDKGVTGEAVRAHVQNLGFGVTQARMQVLSASHSVILGKAPHLSKLHFPPLIRRGMIFVALEWRDEVLLLVGREDVRHNAGHMAGSQQTGFSRTGSGTPASLVQIPSARMRPN